MRPRSLLVCLLVTGCTVEPNHVPPSIGLSPSLVHAASIDTATSTDDWWRGFNDPVLATLVARAVAGNTDLAQARARIDQSRAAARQAGSDLLPTVDATGGATTISQSRNTAIGRVTQALGVGRSYTEYSAGARASWEIDLFGGLRRGREAALGDLAAAQANEGAVRIAVAAETADSYLALRGFQARLAVAEEQERNNGNLVGLVRSRFEQGLSAERELNRAIGQLEGTRASTAALRAGIEAQLNRIDVLVGEQPGTNRALLIVRAQVPAAPMPAGSTAPGELLRRRPDVVAAERRVAASTARIGVAIADYYPRLSLTGLFRFASLGVGNLFTGNAVEASGAAGLRWRLFDFGRVDAEIAGARGRQAEALAAWRGAVLEAAEDVETALARLEQARAERAALDRQVSALTTARRQAQDAYAGGVVALLEVTDANRELLVASDRLATVRADEARAAVAAYRALGGGWSIDQDVALATTDERHK